MEEWKPIVGYEGYYEVSNLGNIRNVERYVINSKNKGKYLKKPTYKKKTINKIGYEVITLHKNGKEHTLAVHRLVALAFIPNYENKSFVNHKDGIKNNNNVNNLEWCTQSENVYHAYRHNLNRKSTPVVCVETGDIFDSCVEAARWLGDENKQSSISMCARGIRKSAYKLHWKNIYPIKHRKERRAK